MRADRDQSGGDRPEPSDLAGPEPRAGNSAHGEGGEVSESGVRPDPGDEGAASAESRHQLPHPHLPHIPHPQLIEPDEDRWKWRAKIRRDPRQLFFYRIAVGVAGLLLMIAAAVTGPLPGPGGIPLFLLGLAVWSSEFEWANNLMGWFRRQFDRYRGWSRGRRLLFWGVVVVGAWTFGYLGMVFYGIPSWFPAAVEEWLRHMPGLV